jgi:hypothetical protein
MTIAFYTVALRHTRLQFNISPKCTTYPQQVSNCPLIIPIPTLIPPYVLSCWLVLSTRPDIRSRLPTRSSRPRRFALTFPDHVHCLSDGRRVHVSHGANALSPSFQYHHRNRPNSHGASSWRCNLPARWVLTLSGMLPGSFNIATLT